MMTRLGLPFAEWPAPDRAIWQALLVEGDPFEPRGAFARLRKTSRQCILVGYGRWFGWLAGTEPDALDENPVARATPERIRAWMRHLAHLSHGAV